MNQCTFFISVRKRDLIIILQDNLLPSPDLFLVNKSAIAGEVFQQNHFVAGVSLTTHPVKRWEMRIRDNYME